MQSPRCLASVFVELFTVFYSGHLCKLDHKVETVMIAHGIYSKNVIIIVH